MLNKPLRNTLISSAVVSVALQIFTAIRVLKPLGSVTTFSFQIPQVILATFLFVATNRVKFKEERPRVAVLFLILHVQAAITCFLLSRDGNASFGFGLVMTSLDLWMLFLINSSQNSRTPQQ